MEKQWIDSTSYSRDDKERKPTCWTWESKNISITVVCSHRYYPENWVMHCRALGIDTMRMQITSDNPAWVAQEEAVSIVKTLIDKIQKELNQ